VIAGVVLAGAAELELTGATVVGVRGGGGLGLPDASGGGSVGVIKLEPKMPTSICWAAGWSTVKTSPRLPNPLAATVGRVCPARPAGLYEW
jgi:hypothetical protein